MKALKFILLLSLALSSAAHAADLNKRMENLGGNKNIYRKARALDPDNKMRIVQNRTVDRTWRLELGVNYGMNAGGDSYIQTQNLGGNIDLHISPRWSIGARYIEHFNELTGEGKRVYDNAQNSNNVDGNWVRPEVDYPLHSTMGVINFYPVYGKLNLFDLTVAQFDMYILGGYGQMQLSSGTSPTWTAGGGIGLWLAKHLATRLEVRYQNYEDQIYSGSRSQDIVVTTFNIGILL